MSRAFRMIGKWIIAILVVAGLAFSASRAMATPVTAACQNDGINWFGVCVSESNCNTICETAHMDPEAIGSCTPVGNCCKCLY